MLVRYLLLLLPLVLQAAATNTNVVVTVDRNTGASATHAFKFAHVPSPVTDDAGAKAKVSIVDGTADPNGGAAGWINDGLLPRDEDEPGANFFFNAGTSGGRLVVDLGAIIDVSQVNSYSWHPNTRGRQIYTLYGSDGVSVNASFNAAPRHGVDPESAGWKKIAFVDTVAQGGDDGGQYGVSVTAKMGTLGRFRYLLFDCAVTETLDDFGNTFYSEIDVIAARTSQQPAPAATAFPGAADNFDPTRDPVKDLAAAIVDAKRSHRRIILDVGGEWCSWCHVLDRYFAAQPELSTARDRSYVWVKINMSPENKNEAFLAKYPAISGYPFLFVLEQDGTLLHSQSTGLLEQGSSYNLDKMREFLTKWAPAAKES